MRQSRGIIAAALLGALPAMAGCERLEAWVTGVSSPETPQETRPETRPASDSSAFAHTAQDDLSGYYLPTEEVRAGRWRLDHLFLGQAADFDAWSAGRREGVFAPVMLEFVDPDSTLVQTELGPVRSGRVRVLPERFEISDTRVAFAGRSDEVGGVAFEGRLDPDALAAARRTLGDGRVVLTGTLTTGGRAVPVALRWWAGD